MGLRKSYCVFFQNETNARIMIDKKVVKDNYRLVPGSGVNLDAHQFEEYPEDNGKISFVTIGRIMTDKGIRELLQAARNIKKDYNNVEFSIIGAYDEEELRSDIEKSQQEGVINYLGVKPDVHPYVKESNAIIHASYHEGMSNVLLEAASAGRPIIATDVPGCQRHNGYTNLPIRFHGHATATTHIPKRTAVGTAPSHAISMPRQQWKSCRPPTAMRSSSPCRRTSPHSRRPNRLRCQAAAWPARRPPCH